jgi:hypothetical protein
VPISGEFDRYFKLLSVRVALVSLVGIFLGNISSDPAMVHRAIAQESLVHP